MKKASSEAFFFGHGWPYAVEDRRSENGFGKDVLYATGAWMHRSGDVQGRNGRKKLLHFWHSRLPWRSFCTQGQASHFQTNPKENLIKYLYRHAGEYQHPANNCFDLILAYARMTGKFIFCMYYFFWQ